MKDTFLRNNEQWIDIEVSIVIKIIHQYSLKCDSIGISDISISNGDIIIFNCLIDLKIKNFVFSEFISEREPFNSVFLALSICQLIMPRK